MRSVSDDIKSIEREITQLKKRRRSLVSRDLDSKIVYLEKIRDRLKQHNRSTESDIGEE